jgi:DNA-binding response OmpR family regulator
MELAHVLLVEDNPGDAQLMQQVLASCSVPVRLHVAQDGEQALQILREPDYKPNLIILDLDIPKISGYGVLALFPLCHSMKTTPIVVFSASENEADVIRAILLGACEYIHKPTDIDAYKTAVTGMVQKWTGHDNASSASPPS